MTQQSHQYLYMKFRVVRGNVAQKIKDAHQNKIAKKHYHSEQKTIHIFISKNIGFGTQSFQIHQRFKLFKYFNYNTIIFYIHFSSTAATIRAYYIAHH